MLISPLSIKPGQNVSLPEVPLALSVQSTSNSQLSFPITANQSSPFNLEHEIIDEFLAENGFPVSDCLPKIMAPQIISVENLEQRTLPKNGSFVRRSSRIKQRQTPYGSSYSAADGSHQTTTQPLREPLIAPDVGMQHSEPTYLTVPQKLEYKGIILPLQEKKSNVTDPKAFVANELWQKQLKFTDYDRIKMIKAYVDKRRDNKIGEAHSNVCRLFVQHLIFKSGWKAVDIAHKTGLPKDTVSNMKYPVIESDQITPEK